MYPDSRHCVLGRLMHADSRFVYLQSLGLGWNRGNLADRPDIPGLDRCQMLQIHQATCSESVSVLSAAVAAVAKMQDDRPGPEDAEPSSVPLDVTSKVSQIDADDLDESLVGMLSEKVERALGNFTVSLRLA